MANLATEVSMQTPAKPWWQSRTLMLNAVVLALAAAEAQLGLLHALVPVNVYALLAFALPVANALLRVVTVQPVAFGQAVPAPAPTPEDQGAKP